MSEVIDRRVTLGGETLGRGIIAGTRSRLEWAGMILTALPVLPLLLGAEFTWWRLLVALVILGAAFLFWTPFPGLLGDRSIAGWIAGEVRFQVQRRREGEFVPAWLATQDPSLTGVGYTVPAALGVVGAHTVTLATGEQACVLRHSNPGRRHFYTVALEMLGETAGVEAEWTFGSAHEEWGRFCAMLARPTSFIRTVQQVTRVVPYDTADHTKWVFDRIPDGVDDRLAESYVQLLDLVGDHTEQHRSWLVLRLPVSPRFSAAAAMIERGDDGELALVAREVSAAIPRARAHGLEVRALDERRLAAVIRALQDASHPIDKIAGLDFERAWLPQDLRARRYVVVQGEGGPWFTRTAVVPRHGIEAGLFSPDFLHPLLSDVAPSVIRTISTVHDLLPAHIARKQAKNDVTLDRSATAEAASRVTDGSEGHQLTASTQRLVDLGAGKGNHGANWTVFITLAARSEQELATACGQIEDAAEAAHITELTYLDGQQGAGLVASLPLARGMGVHK